MQCRLTNQGWTFAVVLALLSFASLTSQSALLLLPVGILGGCYLVNAFSAWRTTGALRVTVAGALHLAEGQRMAQPWRVENKSSRPARFIRVEADGQVLLQAGEIPAETSTHVVPDLVYLRRGVYALNDLRLAGTAPFGLVKASRKLELQGEVVVHPAIYRTASPAAAGFDAVVGGKYSGKRQTASGALFAGVRPFQPGDPFKHIHWKSSAKGPDLMVKTFDEELSGRVAIIADAGHTGDGVVLDDCLRATGSLIFAALDEGHHVEWLDLAALETRLVPPFDDGQDTLDALARIQETRGCLTVENLRAAVEKVSPRAALCLVVTDATPAVLQAVEELAARRRKVALYLPASVPMPLKAAGVAIHRYTAHQVEQVE
jgi:uncharacterized protein (DUF58 family)